MHWKLREKLIRMYGEGSSRCVCRSTGRGRVATSAICSAYLSTCLPSTYETAHIRRRFFSASPCRTAWYAIGRKSTRSRKSISTVRTSMSTCRTPESKLRTRVSKLRTLVSILRTTVSVFRTFVAGAAPETLATAATCWQTAGVPSSHASHAVILHDTNRCQRVVVGWMVESPNAGGQTRSSRQRRSAAILAASNRQLTSGVWPDCVASKLHKGQELESKSIWMYGDGPAKGLWSMTVHPLVVTAPDLARLLSACAYNRYGLVRSSRPLLSAGRHSGIGVSNGPRSCQSRTSESVSRTTISIARTSVSVASGPNAGAVRDNDELARSYARDASSVATSSEGRATGPRETASDHGAGGPARRTPRVGRGGLDPWRSRPETEFRVRSTPIVCPLYLVVHKVLATQDLTA